MNLRTKISKILNVSFVYQRLVDGLANGRADSIHTNMYAHSIQCNLTQNGQEFALNRPILNL